MSTVTAPSVEGLVTSSKDWWRGAVIYQIYPRSYCDSNGDGVGDFVGMTSKLDHVKSLGVDGIWLSPFMKSPQKDFGYDVSDYQDVDPLFGTLDDFRVFLAEAKKRNIKVIIDLVMSHTSDQHPWFVESRASRNNPKASWYVWADAKPDGTPPNNWLSLFGGTAWQWDTRRGQYYMHNFLKQQPDLNVQNVEVQDALLSAAEFWLQLGVSGFRLDVANFCMCDPLLRDNPPRPASLGFDPAVPNCNPYNFQQHVYDKSQPENLDFISRLRALLDKHEDTMSVAEIGDDRGVVAQAEYVAGGNRLHTAYSFEMLRPELHTSVIRKAVEDFFQQPGEGWPAWAFSNHDFPRAVSRWGKGEPALGKMLLALLTSLRGTAFVYQGEELGLTEVEIPFELMQDPYGIEMYPDMKTRDGCRTPMPWTRAGPAAGFSSAARTWLPIPDEHRERAADVQEQDPSSMLHFTRKWLAFRKEWLHVLGFGSIEFCNFPETTVLGFVRRARNPRTGEQDALFCVFNCSAAPVLVHQPENVPHAVEALDCGLVGSYSADTMAVDLPAFGAFVGRMKQ